MISEDQGPIYSDKMESNFQSSELQQEPAANATKPSSKPTGQTHSDSDLLLSVFKYFKIFFKKELFQKSDILSPIPLMEIFSRFFNPGFIAMLKRTSTS